MLLASRRSASKLFYPVTGRKTVSHQTKVKSAAALRSTNENREGKIIGRMDGKVVQRRHGNTSM